MSAFATTANGAALPLATIPEFPTDAFRQQVIAAVGSGRHLLLLTGLPETGAVRLVAAIADEAAGELGIISGVAEGQYPALTPECPQAHYFEREIHESCGIRPDGHPWLKPVRFPPGGRTVGDIDFFEVGGPEVHEVAVGPVHAGVIEPGHFRFGCHGERIMHLEISLGYQHRGVEAMLRGGPDRRSLHVAETLAGDTSIGHATAYCQAVEALAGAACTQGALSWRAAALELERIANHIGDLGALAADVGFLPTAAYCGRLRGDVLNLTALICGSRLGRGWVRPGGIACHPDDQTVGQLKQRLVATERDMRNATDLLWKSSSVRARFENTGALSKQAAADLGITGPVARASGIDRDARRDLPGSAYSGRRPAVAIGETGDVFARAMQRWREIESSLSFLNELLGDPGDGEDLVPLGPLGSDSMTVSVVEGWRGEIVHLAVTNTAGCFRHYKVWDPSFRNWYGLAMAMRDQPILDFPLCNKSFNLSYCGHDL